MKRISKAWGSLGRARQIALVSLIVLMLLQAVVFAVLGWAWLLPAVAVIVLLGFIQIKQSAASRDAVTKLKRVETQLARQTDAFEDLLRASRDLSSGAPRDATRELGLLREQVGRTVAQFTWLGERVLETKQLVQSTADGTAVDGDRTIAMYRELRETLERISSRIDAQEGHASLLSNESGNEIATVVSELDQRVTRALDAGNSHSLERHLVAELSALSLLTAQAGEADLPPFDSWAMSPLTVRTIRSFALKVGSDATIVELGSGVSTAWIANALTQVDHPARFVSLDHSREYAARTSEYIRNLDASENVEVLHAPLAPASVDGQVFTWYSTDWIDGVENIELLIVDGPPAGEDTTARYPALPLLLDRMADDAMIIVDDFDRPGEAEMVKTWLALPGVEEVGPVGRSLVLSYVKPREVAK